ncbi:sugar phosphate nucleotidyltransferase [Breoghania sp. L-A4]|uniref:sugar phosphate nucleotidyltransferase n=1 Tax=Breoghania sp. L-A4 TaxID=2304600 RepID=UPI000E35E20E|nr:sugar phosphate nucleotidyltransferase [Breoghania sp. L-A4]AXS40639.1 phosphohexose mutase [Breoghania sp. L-A4]
MSAAGPKLTTAIVLAGGLGTRLRSEVPDLPKAMAPVGDRPFLQHQLDFWIDAGIGRVILSVGYRRDVIINCFGDSYRNVPIEYAVEETPLGTGGGVLLASALLDPDQPFLLLNGDTFFDVSLDALARFHSSKRADLSVAVFHAGEAGRYGLAELDAENRVHALASIKAGVGDPANGGVYCLAPRILDPWREPSDRVISFENEILPGMLASGLRLYGMESPGWFIDIGLPADYRRALETIVRD